MSRAREIAAPCWTSGPQRCPASWDGTHSASARKVSAAVFDVTIRNKGSTPDATATHLDRQTPTDHHGASLRSRAPPQRFPSPLPSTTADHESPRSSRHVTRQHLSAHQLNVYVGWSQKASQTRPAQVTRSHRSIGTPPGVSLVITPGLDPPVDEVLSHGRPGLYGW